MRLSLIFMACLLSTSAYAGTNIPVPKPKPATALQVVSPQDARELYQLLQAGTFTLTGAQSDELERLKSVLANIVNQSQPAPAPAQ
jgi:hypothetical protein